MPPPLSKRSKPNPLKFLGQCPFPRSSNCSLLSSSFSMHLVGPMPISKELKLNYWFNSFLVINFLELWNKLLFFAMQLKTFAKLPSKTKFLDSVKRKFQKLEIHEFFIAEILPPQQLRSPPSPVRRVGGEKARIQNVNLRAKICQDILSVMISVKSS